MFSDTGKTLDNVVLTLGMVGPAARSEVTQKFIHKNVTDSKRPQGWNNQLKDEPGVILTYERKWREVFSASRNSAGFDMMPNTRINLGNVYSDASTGELSAWAMICRLITVRREFVRVYRVQIFLCRWKKLAVICFQRPNCARWEEIFFLMETLSKPVRMFIKKLWWELCRLAVF